MNIFYTLEFTASMWEDGREAGAGFGRQADRLVLKQLNTINYRTVTEGKSGLFQYQSVYVQY
jgi:hypothetical protein